MAGYLAEVFLCKNRHYYPVSRAKELLRLFPESKGYLRAYVRAQKLTFKAASRELSIAAVVRSTPPWSRSPRPVPHSPPPTSILCPVLHA